MCGQAYGSPLTGTELQLNEVVRTRRTAGYRSDARDVWRKISVKIIDREGVIRGKKPMPAGEDSRIIGVCISATKE